MFPDSTAGVPEARQTAERPDPLEGTPAAARSHLAPSLAEPLDQVSLSQLRELTLLTEYGSISGVARMLGKTQSAVSRSLQQLQEKFSHCILYKSDPTGVVLTEQGHQLAQLAKRILGELREFREQEVDQRQLIQIGGGAATLHSLVLPQLRAIRQIFEEEGRNCRLEVLNRRSEDTVRCLLEQELDFGIVRPSAVSLHPLEYQNLGKVGYVLVMQEVEAKRLQIRSCADLEDAAYPVLSMTGLGEFKRELRIRMRESQSRLMLADELEFFRDIMVAVRFNPVAGIVPETELLHLPDRQSFRILELPFMTAADYSREFVLAYLPRHLDERNITARQVGGLVDLLQRSIKKCELARAALPHNGRPPRHRGWFARRLKSGQQ